MSKQSGHKKVAFAPTFLLLFFYYYYFFKGQRGRRSLCPVSHQEAAAGDPTPRALPFLPMPTPFAEVPWVPRAAAAQFGGALPASEAQRHQEIKATGWEHHPQHASFGYHGHGIDAPHSDPPGRIVSVPNFWLKSFSETVLCFCFRWSKGTQCVSCSLLHTNSSRLSAAYLSPETQHSKTGGSKTSLRVVYESFSGANPLILPSAQGEQKKRKQTLQEVLRKQREKELVCLLQKQAGCQPPPAPAPPEL